MTGTLLAVDIGGTGSRVRVIDPHTGAGADLDGTAVSVGRAGIPTEELLEGLLQRAGATSARPPLAVAVGMSGVLSLGGGVERLTRIVKRRWPHAEVAAASDAVTALVGALGMSGGAVVAAGTGAIALGSDLGSVWRRVDGWGHLLGDDGGGAWIGMRGLREALRQHDGREPAGRLVEAARDAFGDLDVLPSHVYTRDDRAGVLASFAPRVLDLAADGDEAAVGIARCAGRSLAGTALAALAPGVPRRVALSGGIARAGGVLVAEFERALARGGVLDVRVGTGTSIDGAATLAQAMIRGDLVPHHPPYIARLA